MLKTDLHSISESLRISQRLTQDIENGKVYTGYRKRKRLTQDLENGKVDTGHRKRKHRETRAFGGPC